MQVDNHAICVYLAQFEPPLCYTLKSQTQESINGVSNSVDCAKYNCKNCTIGERACKREKYTTIKHVEIHTKLNCHLCVLPCDRLRANFILNHI